MTDTQAKAFSIRRCMMRLSRLDQPPQPVGLDYDEESSYWEEFRRERDASPFWTPSSFPRVWIWVYD